MNRYDRHIFICINKRELESETRKSCGKEGLALKAELSKQLYKREINAKIRINKSGCLNECELGPALVVYPKGDWYTKVTINDIPEIIEKSIIN